MTTFGGCGYAYTTGVGNTTTTLKAATGSPLVIRTVNNDEDPFVPVRGARK